MEADHILQLEITIEQLIKERDALTQKCNALKIQNEYQAQQLESLRDKIKGTSPTSNVHSKHTSVVNPLVINPTPAIRTSKVVSQLASTPVKGRLSTTPVNAPNSTSPSLQTAIFNALSPTVESLELPPADLSSLESSVEPVALEASTPPILQSTFPVIQSEPSPLLPKKDIMYQKLKSSANGMGSTSSLNDTYNSTRAVLRSTANSHNSLNDLTPKNLPSKPVEKVENGMHNALRQRTQYDILVLTSCIRFPDKMRELITFIISIKDKEKDKEMWRIEKSYTDFCHFEEILKTNDQSAQEKIGRLPEKSLFVSHSPLKNDKRKIALELYLAKCQEHLEVLDPLINFLSTNIVENQTLNAEIKKKTGVKDGYLIKKGKNFGGWKIRYFVLKHGILDSFETKEGELNGSLKLKYCLVSSFPDSYAEEIRHALIITEYKKGTIPNDTYPTPPPDSKIISKYILCAENDLERNEWIAFMDAHIQKLRLYTSPEHSSQLGATQKQTSVIISDESLNVSSPTGGKIPMVRSLQEAFDTPVNGSLDDLGHSQSKILPMPPGSINRVATYKSQNSSAGTDVSGGTPVITSKSEHRTSFGYRSHTVASGTPKKIVDDNERVLSKPAAVTFVVAREKSAGGKQNPTTKGEKGGLRGALGVFSSKSKKVVDDQTKKVFGVSLQVALQISRISDAIELPAVFYRCIEYLEFRKAELEEGLYRLSGSTATVQLLKEKFNTDVDFDLVDSPEMYDMHAVSGLLKLYLRELPEPLLTLELHRDFIRIMDITERHAKVAEIVRLIGLLPSANYSILKALSGHLNRVVHSSEINKMTVRNISIVFSPTLNIPAGVLSIFMSEYGCVYEGEAYDLPIEESPKEVTVLRPASKMAGQRPEVPSVYISEKNSIVSTPDGFHFGVDGVNAMEYSILLDAKDKNKVEYEAEADLLEGQSSDDEPLVVVLDDE